MFLIIQLSLHTYKVCTFMRLVLTRVYHDRILLNSAVPHDILQAKPSMVINLQNESLEMYEKSLYSNVYQSTNLSHENKNIFKLCPQSTRGFEFIFKLWQNKLNYISIILYIDTYMWFSSSLTYAQIKYDSWYLLCSGIYIPVIFGGQFVNIKLTIHYLIDIKSI